MRLIVIGANREGVIYTGWIHGGLGSRTRTPSTALPIRLEHLPGSVFFGKMICVGAGIEGSDPRIVIGNGSACRRSCRTTVSDI